MVSPVADFRSQVILTYRLNSLRIPLENSQEMFQYTPQLIPFSRKNAFLFPAYISNDLPTNLFKLFDLKLA